MITNTQRNTVSEIREKYPDNWFRYGVKQDDSIYAVYIVDTHDELLSVSDEKMKKDGFWDWGDVCPKRLEPQYPIEIGGVEIEWVD